MDLLKSGKMTTEFWGLIILVALVIMGMIKPEQATQAISAGADPVEIVMNTLKHIAESKGDLAIYAGILWAYIKRRSALKSKVLDKG